MAPLHREPVRTPAQRMAANPPGMQSAPHPATRARSGFFVCLSFLAGYVKYFCRLCENYMCRVRAINCETCSAPDLEKIPRSLLLRGNMESEIPHSLLEF